MVKKVERRIRIWKFMFFCESFVVKRLHNEVLVLDYDICSDLTLKI